MDRSYLMCLSQLKRKLALLVSADTEVQSFLKTVSTVIVSLDLFQSYNVNYILGCCQHGELEEQA